MMLPTYLLKWVYTFLFFFTIINKLFTVSNSQKDFKLPKDVNSLSVFLVYQPP
uniref:Uncharacterized protein n=1 Tax=Anguilla anguilla TaxID=7936 RepID=A0A0E9WJY2_ANGAN